MERYNRFEGNFAEGVPQGSGRLALADGGVLLGTYSRGAKEGVFLFVDGHTRMLSVQLYEQDVLQESLELRGAYLENPDSLGLCALAPARPAGTSQREYYKLLCDELSAALFEMTPDSREKEAVGKQISERQEAAEAKKLARNIAQCMTLQHVPSKSVQINDSRVSTPWLSDLIAKGLWLTGGAVSTYSWAELTSESQDIRPEGLNAGSIRPARDPKSPKAATPPSVLGRLASQSRSTSRGARTRAPSSGSSVVSRDPARRAFAKAMDAVKSCLLNNYDMLRFLFAYYRALQRLGDEAGDSSTAPPEAERKGGRRYNKKDHQIQRKTYRLFTESTLAPFLPEEIVSPSRLRRETLEALEAGEKDRIDTQNAGQSEGDTDSAHSLALSDNSRLSIASRVTKTSESETDAPTDPEDIESPGERDEGLQGSADSLSDTSSPGVFLGPESSVSLERLFPPDVLQAPSIQDIALAMLKLDSCTHATPALHSLKVPVGGICESSITEEFFSHLKTRQSLSLGMADRMVFELLAYSGIPYVELQPEIWEAYRQCLRPRDDALVRSLLGMRGVEEDPDPDELCGYDLDFDGFLSLLIHLAVITKEYVDSSLSGTGEADTAASESTKDSQERNTPARGLVAFLTGVVVRFATHILTKLGVLASESQEIIDYIAGPSPADRKKVAASLQALGLGGTSASVLTSAATSRAGSTRTTPGRTFSGRGASSLQQQPLKGQQSFSLLRTQPGTAGTAGTAMTSALATVTGVATAARAPPLVLKDSNSSMSFFGQKLLGGMELDRKIYFCLTRSGQGSDTGNALVRDTGGSAVSASIVRFYEENFLGLDRPLLMLLMGDTSMASRISKVWEKASSGSGEGERRMPRDFANFCTEAYRVTYPAFRSAPSIESREAVGGDEQGNNAPDGSETSEIVLEDVFSAIYASLGWKPIGAPSGVQRTTFEAYSLFSQLHTTPMLILVFLTTIGSMSGRIYRREAVEAAGESEGSQDTARDGSTLEMESTGGLEINSSRGSLQDSLRGSFLVSDRSGTLQAGKGPRLSVHYSRKEGPKAMDEALSLLEAWAGISAAEHHQ